MALHPNDQSLIMRPLLEELRISSNFSKEIPRFADSYSNRKFPFVYGEENMKRFVPNALRLEEIETDADFILFSESEGVISEHCTQGEARMAFFQEANRHTLGQCLPRIYRREESNS